MSNSTINQILQIIKNEFRSDEFIPLHQPFFGGNEKKYLEIIHNLLSYIGDEDLMELTYSIIE